MGETQSWQDDPSVQYTIASGGRVVHDPRLSRTAKRLLTWDHSTTRLHQDLQLGLGALVTGLLITAVAASMRSPETTLVWVLTCVAALLALAVVVGAPLLVRSRAQGMSVSPGELALVDGAALALGARRADEAVAAAHAVAEQNPGLVHVEEVQRSVETDLWGAAELLQEATGLEEDLDELGVAPDGPGREAVQRSREAAKQLLQAVEDTHRAALALEHTADPRWALIQDRVDQVQANAEVSLEQEPASREAQRGLRTFDRAVKDLPGPTLS